MSHSMPAVERLRPHADRRRQGAIVPLFAILLPIVLILCGFAINVAYMQLTKTEMRTATDAAARAAGRAFSEYQSVREAKRLAHETAGMNTVAGEPLKISTRNAANEIEFGLARRTDGGYGRYEFEKKDTQAVANQTEEATSVRINARRDIGSRSGPVKLLFAGFGPFSTFEPLATAISTQVDRDIALILDRSGSMAYETVDYSQYYTWVRRNRRWVREWNDPDMEAEYNEYQQQYNDYINNNGPVPDASRWVALVQGVDAFLDVLDETDQEELVSLATFSSSATLDLNLVSDYQVIRDHVAGIRPSGATAIGQGMETGLPTLIGSMARPYAAKTIVVLTDGINNRSPEPTSVARTIVSNYNVTIHTVTFSEGADQSDMQEVAQIGGGEHYHADQTEELVDIFREIANNLPTIITE